MNKIKQIANNLKILGIEQWFDYNPERWEWQRSDYTPKEDKKWIIQRLDIMYNELMIIVRGGFKGEVQDYVDNINTTIHEILELKDLLKGNVSFPKKKN